MNERAARGPRRARHPRPRRPPQGGHAQRRQPPARRDRQGALDQRQVLIMDEPTAALTEADVEQLFGIVRLLRARRRRSSTSATGWPRSSSWPTGSPCCATARYVDPAGRRDDRGRPRPHDGRPRDHRASSPSSEPRSRRDVLEVARLCPATACDDVSFKLRGGEILGMAGLVGSGRTEMAQVIFGITPADSGTIVLDGKPVDHHLAGPGDEPGHRLRAGGPRPAGPGPRDAHPREHLDGHPRHGRPASASSIASAERRVGDAMIQQLGIRHQRRAGGRASCPAATSRRSCVGKWLASKPRHPDHGRADARHRRRRQGRDPPAHGRARRRRDGAS